MDRDQDLDPQLTPPGKNIIFFKFLHCVQNVFICKSPEIFAVDQIFWFASLYFFTQILKTNWHFMKYPDF